MQCLKCNTTKSSKWYKSVKLCNSCYQKEYYLRNREKIISNADEWRINNPEKYRKTRRKIDKRKYASLTIEERREKWRQRKRKMSNVEKEKRAKQSKQYYYKNKEAIIAKRKQYRENNKNKDNAHRAIENAVRRKTIPHISTQKCIMCFNTATVYHHWSYSETYWLDTLSLCNACHGHVHSV